MTPDADPRFEDDAPVLFRADLGRDRRLDELANVLRDLGIVVDLGEQANHRARRNLIYRAASEGP